MFNKLAVAAVACMAVTGCSYLGLSDSTGRSQTTASAQNTQTMQAGLVRVPASALVGRPIRTEASKAPSIVSYVLAEPNQRAARYVAIDSSSPGSYVLVPAEWVTSGADGLAVNASAQQLAELPHVSQTDIERSYPAQP